MPCDIDVIQLWIFCFDKSVNGSGGQKITPNRKIEVINEIIEILVDHMKTLDTDKNIE